MTTRGYAFKEIAYHVNLFHGFGSTKTTEVYYSTLCPECGCKYTKADLDWLVDNGYLFHYVWNGKKGSKQDWGHYHNTDHHIYGLTKKGWSVARKYLDAA